MSGEQPQVSKPAPKLWLAALPGLLVFAGAAGMFLYSSRQFSQAGAAITEPAAGETSLVSKPAPSELMACIETYAVSMHTSESYVSEMNGFPRQRPKNAPAELSTVLRGMVRNNCGRPVRRLEIFIEVRDAEGRRGSGWTTVGSLDLGQAGTFERAWMGRVTEYKVTKAR
jgi:hypothetical protein